MKIVIIAIDIQREYNTAGRPFSLVGIAPSLNAAQAVLTGARKSGVPVIHVRHLQEGQIFNPESDHSLFIEGFEPQQGEKEVTKGNFSCFSSPDFTKALAELADREVVVIGYGSTMCCLSTIIEGYHRGYKMAFVKDASFAKATPSFDEATLHKAMVEVLGAFSRITDSQTLLAEMAHDQ